eukprot:Selendium_serpulae@DN4908_c0_g1_i2.p1
MATIGSANFDEDDSEDDDYVDSGGDSEDSDGENDEGQEDDGPNQIAAQAQREVAAAQYKEMLETEKSTMAAPYVPTPDAKFMLQFQKRQPPLTIKQNSNVNDLLHYLDIGVGECRTEQLCGKRKPVHLDADGAEANLSSELVRQAMEEVDGGGALVTITRTVRYAGQTTRVQQKVQRGSKLHQTIERENAVDGAHGGGMADLDKLMAELGDKKKITSIEKSQADWLHYRETQGGEDELRQNRKDGYLQKQKFLRRTEAGADFA